MDLRLCVHIVAVKIAHQNQAMYFAVQAKNSKRYKIIAKQCTHDHDGVIRNSYESKKCYFSSINNMSLNSVEADQARARRLAHHIFISGAGLQLRLRATPLLTTR